MEGPASLQMQGEGFAVQKSLKLVHMVDYN